jgi:hypothetical protein
MDRTIDAGRARWATLSGTSGRILHPARRSRVASTRSCAEEPTSVHVVDAGANGGDYEMVIVDGELSTREAIAAFCA